MAKKETKTTKKQTPTTRKRTLGKKDLLHFREMLLEKRHQLVGNVNEIQNEALKKSRMEAAGDLSCMPIHMADMGTDNYEQEFALELMDNEIKLLKKIDKALIRIANGTYGKCVATGKLISKARLNAKPWAKYSVEFATKLEQGLVKEPQ